MKSLKERQLEYREILKGIENELGEARTFRRWAELDAKAWEDKILVGISAEILSEAGDTADAGSRQSSQADLAKNQVPKASWAEKQLEKWREPASEGYRITTQLEQWRRQAADIPPEYREDYLAGLDYAEKLNTDIRQRLTFLARCAFLGERLIGSRYDESDELVQAAKGLCDKTASEDISQLIAKRTAFTRLYGRMWDPEAPAMGAEDLTSAAALTAIRQDMGERGYNHEAFSRMTQTVSGAVSGLYEKLDGLSDGTERPEELTQAEQEFAVQSFDAMAESIFPQEVRDSLQEQGKDIFDQIFVEGQSMRERYGEMLAGESYREEAEGMKCQLLADAVKGKQIDAAVPAEDGLTMQPVTALEAVWRPKRQQAADRERADYTEEIQASQARLDARSAYEKDLVTKRMLTSRYENIRGRGPVDADVDLELVDGEGQLGRLYRLGAEPLASQAPESKEELTRAGADAFRLLLGDKIPERELSNQIYRDMGVAGPEDLIYIDGKKARDYLKDNGLGPDEQEIRAGIMSALLSGEHHVDMARVGVDEKGSFTVEVTELKADLHVLDQQKKWYQHSLARRAAGLYKDTAGTEKRLRELHDNLAPEIALAGMKALQKSEDSRTLKAYQAADKRFRNNGVDLTNTYFDPEARAMLEASVKEHKELGRGNPGEYGGSLRLAQLYLMAKNPNVRYADLMDPNKFRQEKLEAGRAVAEALDDFRLLKEQQSPKFEKLVGVLAAGVRAMGQLDVRKELLYALGQPDTLSNEELRGLLRSPEGNIRASGFLDSIGIFGQSASQAISRLDPRISKSSGKIDVQHLDQIGKESFEPYLALQARLRGNELHDYLMAIQGLEVCFKSDKAWNKKALSALNGAEPDPAMTAGLWMDRMISREWLVSDGKLCNLTEAQLAGYVARQEAMGDPATREKLAPDVRTANAMIHGEALPGGQRRLSAAQIFAWKARTEFEQNCICKLGGEGTPYSRLDEIGGIRTIDRPISHSSIARGTMLIAGYSLEETLRASEDELHRAGEELTGFIEERPVRKMEDGPQRDAALKDYAEFYQAWGEQLLKEKIPDIDYGDPMQVAANIVKLAALANQSIDYSQSEEYLRKEPGYADNLPEGFGRETAQAFGVMQTLARNYLALLKPGDMDANKLVGAYMLQEYGPRLAGKSVQELGRQADPIEMMTRAGAAYALFAPLSEKELGDYLENGFPQEMRDRLDQMVEQMLPDSRRGIEQDEQRKAAELAEKREKIAQERAARERAAKERAADDEALQQGRKAMEQKGAEDTTAVRRPITFETLNEHTKQTLHQETEAHRHSREERQRQRQQQAHPHQGGQLHGR